LAAVCTLGAGEAHAAPGEWSIAIERVFGLSRIEVTTELPGGGEDTTEITAVSLGAKRTGQVGYSPARFAVDYLASSGLTVGGALAYESVDIDEDTEQDWWLFALRVGYLASIGDGVGIWPRGGITHTSFDPGPDSFTATALTLEVPLVIYAMGHRVGFEIMPYADIGIAGGTDDVDVTTTEFGLQFNLGTFF
jgi:hypothetical protein